MFKPESISSENISVEYNSDSELTIQILPQNAGAGKTVTVSSASPSIANPSSQSVTANENGEATVLIHGNLPGEAEITLTLDGTDITSTATVAVANVKAEPFSITNEQLADNKYSATLHFDSSFNEQSAKAVIALYDENNRLVTFSTANITVKPGTQDISIPLTSTHCTYYKLLIWDYILNPVPIVTATKKNNS